MKLTTHSEFLRLEYRQYYVRVSYMPPWRVAITAPLTGLTSFRASPFPRLRRDHKVYNSSLLKCHGKTFITRLTACRSRFCDEKKKNKNVFPVFRRVRKISKNDDELQAHKLKRPHKSLIFVWPCIINNGGKEESQLDATITVYW
jgi:hypothetical protein